MLFPKQILFLAMMINGGSHIIAGTLPEPTIEDCKRISPSIVVDLADFGQLIDKVTVDAIVAQHYLFDKNFRKAFEYLQTNDFLNTMSELQNVPEVNDILNYLQILVPCSDMGLDVPKLEFVLLDALIHEENLRYERQRRSIEMTTTSTSLSSVTNLNSFTSFVKELLHELPRTSYTNMIKAKCEKSSQFKSFYKALRSAAFKTRVEEAMKTSNVAPYLKKLNSHGIDVQSLLPIFLELVSWGPDVQ